MDPDRVRVGDTVADSPVGPGVVTGFTEVGYPLVNKVAVTWIKRTDGAVFDPHHRVGRPRPKPQYKP